MTVLRAAVLGIIQGLTEFLPVSSSAHLVIVQYWMGLEGPIMLVFDVVVHVGTLLAVLAYFAKDLLFILKKDFRYIVLIALATIPTAVIGLLLKKTVEGFFTTLAPVALTLLVNSFVLFSTQFVSSQKARPMFSFAKAFWVGLAQGISVLPGISRSGATISAALWLGVKADEAARFSFLIAIPAILGAMVLVLPEGLQMFDRSQWPALLVGFGTAFVSGFLAIAILMKLMMKGRFHYFAFYTLLLSLISFLFARA